MYIIRPLLDDYLLRLVNKGLRDVSLIYSHSKMNMLMSMIKIELKERWF